LDQRLAILVVPEADTGGLALLDRAGGGGPLAEVVVQRIDAARQAGDGELVSGNGPAGGADGIDALRVAGRLRLGDRVRARPRANPLIVNVSPTAETGLPLALWTSSPAPLTLIVFPPGLAVVPRSTEPPVIQMAAWA